MYHFPFRPLAHVSIVTGLSWAFLFIGSACGQTGSMRGFADLHNHQFANMAFGGYVVAGEASGPASSALSVLECQKGHSFRHDFDVLGGYLAGYGGAIDYANDGYPTFSGWPAFFEVSHQKTNQDFLYRAVQGGMRLMVMFAVESPILCEAVKNGGGKTDGRNCLDEMTSIKNQLTAAYTMQDYLDHEAGGPGKGWYRIVTTPQEARDVIQAGKLAVVLGVETSHLFQCDQEPCSWQAQFDELWNLGVRHYFPIHQDKNAFGGPSYFQPTIQNGVKLLGVNPYTFPWHSCSYGFGKCDNLGLTASGASFVQTLIARGGLIDVDHMSDLSFAGTLSLSERTGYPVVASHSAFNAVSQRSQDHEGQLTLAELTRIQNVGGMLGLISSPGDILTVGTYKRTEGPTLEHNCGRSSETFAQMYYYARDNAPKIAVGIGTDMNGPLRQIGPRFGDRACDGGVSGRPRNSTRLPLSFLARGSNVVLSRSVVGTRIFDFNVDGLAHEGMLPDMFADLEELGMSASDTEPLFHSAEGYVTMWERAQAISSAHPGIKSVADSLNRVLRVHYVGTDSHVHELSISNGWHDGDLTGAIGAPSVAPESSITSVADTLNGVLRVYYVGSDSHLHELSISGGNWHHGDLTAVVGGPNVAAGSTVAASTDTINRVFRVHYVGVDSHLHEFSISGNKWHSADLTAAIGGPPVSVGSSIAAVADTLNGVFRVHYVGADSHVHELSISGGWHDGDLTAVIGGAPVSPGSSVTSAVDTINGVFRVHYVGTDSHVHELSISGGSWHHGDLTAAIGAPNAFAGSSLATAVDVINGVFRIHYAASDSHLHELSISGGWHDGDLTAVIGGPGVAPGSSISSVVDVLNGVFRVHYAGLDSHVHEFSISGGWHDGDLTAVIGGPGIATSPEPGGE